MYIYMAPRPLKQGDVLVVAPYNAQVTAPGLT